MIPLPTCSLLNIDGELEDLEKALKAPKLRRVSEGGHSSALVKVLPDNSELFVSHVTGSRYSTMLRILKKYTLNYHQTHLGGEFPGGNSPTSLGILARLNFRFPSRDSCLVVIQGYSVEIIQEAEYFAHEDLGTNIDTNVLECGLVSLSIADCGSNGHVLLDSGENILRGRFPSLVLWFGEYDVLL